MVVSPAKRTGIRPRLLAAGGGSATRRSMYTDRRRKPRRSAARRIRVVEVWRRMNRDVPLWAEGRADHLPTRPGDRVSRHRVFHGPRAADGRHDTSVPRRHTGAHRRRNTPGIARISDVRRTGMMMLGAVPAIHH